MSEKQRAGMTSVMFVSRHGSTQFPTPMPLPPLPYLLAKPQSENRILLRHLVLGLVCLTAHTAVAPLERVHLLIQNQNEMIESVSLSTPYKGMKDCFQRTIKQEGIISLWRGNSANVFKAFTSQALAFVIMKNSWHKVAHKKNDEYGYLKYEAAVLGATLLQYPLDYARTLLANDVKAARNNLINREMVTRQFSGMFDVYRKTLKKDGIIGLYRGYYLSVIGILAWEISKEKVEEQQHTKLLHKVVPTTMLYSLPVALYPMTTVSRRMMMNSGEATTKYKNPAHAFREIVKHEGFCSLYKGVTAGMSVCFARICVGKACAQVVPYVVNQFLR